MCHFFSAIATKDKMYTAVGVDSHEQIIEIYNLKHLDKQDKDGQIGLVRFEFLPPEKMSLNFKAWTFKVDQDMIPDWWVASEWKAKTIDYLKSMTVKDQRILSSQCLFLIGEVREVLSSGFIRNILKNGSVGDNYGSVRDNYGSVRYNYGSVRDNYGSVGCNSGSVGDNYGTIQSGKDAHPKPRDKK